MTFRAIIMCCVIVSPGPVAVAAPPATVFAPDASIEGDLRLEGRTWVANGTGYALSLRRLNQDERRAYLRRMTGSDTDPFATPADRAPRFLTFLLTLENRAEGSLSLNAHSCWLSTNKNEILLPVSLDQIGTSYGLLDRELPAAYNQVRSAVLGGSLLLAPGDATSGLLVYRTFKARTKSFRVDLQLTLPSGDVIRLTAPYRRLKRRG